MMCGNGRCLLCEISKVRSNLKTCIWRSQKHHCATLKKALGEVLNKEYIAVKRSEWRGFYNKDPEWEIEKHVYVY